MKKFLFYLGHPAHYHYFSHIIGMLANKGHRILLVAREKDVLGELLKDCSFETVMLPPRRAHSKTGTVISVLKREVKLLRIAGKHRPDLMIGTDIVITHTGRLLGIPTVVSSEDDAAEIPQFVRWGYRYATHILAPQSCNCSPYRHKHIAFPGYLELAYLHPAYFKPERSFVEHLFKNGNNAFFILRLAQLTAFHDKGKRGIEPDMAKKIIELLSQKGEVYISAEGKLPPELEQYRLPLPAQLIHHALYFARLYIGDSQTMACEAAVLGTPSVRFNDFVGKLGYLEELEHRFGLTCGISASNPVQLLSKIKELLGKPGLEKEWATKRQHMLEHCIDVNTFLLWLFEHYPKSATQWQYGNTDVDKFKSSAPHPSP